ncbi:hypothetical protein WR25_26025 [Diploscapter pachys]|uniref:Uncharacterized protein n=1 Tax=Diploscapter pachys TaxID=2018661 RepID=A0A2A2K546_9BILA|nr:hypothetical protein WR25_26025 [Diploscapter pachys]
MVKLVQVDVREQRRDDASLRRATIGFVETLLLQIPCLQHRTDESGKPPIINATFKQAQQFLVRDVVEVSFDIDFDQPLHALPCLADMVERRVTRPPPSKAV